MRAIGKRFGSTDETGLFAIETGLFAMAEEGLEEVVNPSSLFLTGVSAA